MGDDFTICIFSNWLYAWTIQNVQLYSNSSDSLWYVLSVLYTEGWVCDVALIEYTLGPGKPKKGWDFGREGTRGQRGTKGVSLQATWDWGGRFLSQLEGAK
jgi:hypothetical protein